MSNELDQQHLVLQKLQLMRWAQMHQIPVKMGKHFEDFVSYAPKSIPGAGSPTRKVRELRWNLIFEDISKITVHDCGDVTIHTPTGNVRFWRKP